MIQSLRVLVAVGAMVLAAAGCQKGAQSGAKGSREASGGGPAAKSTEAPARASRSDAPVASASASGPAVRAGRLTLTAPENGTALDLRQGEVVTVVLPCNRSAGLSWTLSEASGTVILPEGKPVYAPNKAAESGGTETWRFRAARRGEQAVRLEYGRAWQRSVPERTFHFTASVR